MLLRKGVFGRQLLDHRKEEFKLPNIKKRSSCLLNLEENLKLLKEKEIKKKKEVEEKPNDVNYDKEKGCGIIKKGRRKNLNKIKVHSCSYSNIQHV